MATPVSRLRITRRTKKTLCAGCRDNCYNCYNPLGVSGCWNFPTSRVVRRWEIAADAPRDRKESFRLVRILDCYHTAGRSYLEKLPPRFRGRPKGPR